MKELLKRLYFWELNDSDAKFGDLHDTPSYKESREIFKKLEDTFSKEQLRLYLQFESVENKCGMLECELAYANGFKTGFWFALDLMNFNPAD